MKIFSDKRLTVCLSLVICLALYFVTDNHFDNLTKDFFCYVLAPGSESPAACGESISRLQQENFDEFFRRFEEAKGGIRILKWLRIAFFVFLIFLFHLILSRLGKGNYHYE